MRLKKLVAVMLPLVLIFAMTPAVSAETVEGYHGSMSAQAAVLMDASTGQVLYAHNETQRLPMASTTKIMSALLTLEQPGLDEYFTVDSGAIQVEGSSMGLQEGDQASLRALAYGMLLPSGNDAANAAAMQIGGEITAFVEQMNQRAEAIGMTNTHFVTPSGLHDAEHYSTAYDMALLAQEALKNTSFREICSTQSAQVEYGNPPYARWLTNSNKLLRNYEGCIGIKTGFTKKAGRCLVAAAERGGITLIAVVLNDGDDWNDVSSLFGYGFSVVTPYIMTPDLEGVSIAVTGGQRSTAAVQPYSNAVVSVDPSLVTQRVVAKPFYYAPVQAGEIVGTVEYLYEGEVIASQPILCSETVERKITEINHSLGYQISQWFERVKQWFGG